VPGGWGELAKPCPKPAVNEDRASPPKTFGDVADDLHREREKTSLTMSDGRSSVDVAFGGSRSIKPSEEHQKWAHEILFFTPTSYLLDYQKRNVDRVATLLAALEYVRDQQWDEYVRAAVKLALDMRVNGIATDKDVDDLLRAVHHRRPVSTQHNVEQPRVELKDHGHCHADDDGYCTFKDCPQLRDGEPKKSGRHCPRDKHEDE